MWKITRLYLKNFIHVYAGMHKTEIELDLSNNSKKINIFIGKMGSGKSSILGHLQPFSTYGTLDIRNQESLILPGEDGVKEIDYIHNGNIYTIQHKYTWNKNGETHSTKSYIQLNGNELNENGNIRTFKEIIRTEFGIDQNFLRLLRLGPNVANLINMKSTERKSFIASLLKDTEIYAVLYQKLSEDYRNMNSALSVLSNKLVGLSSDNENALKAELEDLEDSLHELHQKIDSKKAEIARMFGINSALSGKVSPDKLVIEARSIEDELKQMRESLAEIENALTSIPEQGIQDISIRYGNVSARLNTTHESILNLQTAYSENQANRNKLKEFLLIQNNDEQLNALKRKSEEIRTRYNKYLQALQGFQCNYSYSYLTGLPATIQNFQIALEEMSMNKREVIGKIYNSDGSIIPWAKKKLQILIGSQVNTQKLISNIKFSAEYQSPIPLFRPPMCPTKDCPFIQSHPQVIKENSKDPRNDTVMKLKEQLDALEIEIAVHEDYIAQYPKMQILKKMWESISSVLDNLGVLDEKNLYRILTSLDSRCNWYNYDRLIDITERVKMKEDFAQLQNEYYKVENEMLALQNADIEQKKRELEELEKASISILEDLESAQKLHGELSTEKDNLQNIMSLINSASAYAAEKSRLVSAIETKTSELSEISDKIAKISSNLQNIKIVESEVASLGMIYTETNNRAMKLRMTLQEIASTKSSYQEYLDERNTLKLILDAVSSKEGIPLIMVKVFLDECKEIINDLISDIFEDDLEIVDFDISETSNEFKIPYKINGNYVPDIELASQGQQSVISIALSFALCRKSMFDYNIMLLDEIDNSIYKADREKFIMILAKQMQALGTEQVFLITHNDIFQQSGLPVNIIMTTREIIDSYPNQSIMQLY